MKHKTTKNIKTGDFITTRTYINCYKPNKKKNLGKALKIALDTRKFEIELYWKRTGYFALFIGALFIGYYTILTSDKIAKEERKNFLLLLTGLGFLLSLLWYMVNRGSKFWQENWESHIEELSTHLGIPIFGIIKAPKHSIKNLMEEYPFSVSKINQMVSLIITCTWLLMFFKEFVVFDLHKNIPDEILCRIFFFGFIIVILPYFIITWCKSFVARKQIKKKNDSRTIYYYHYKQTLNTDNHDNI